MHLNLKEVLGKKVKQELQNDASCCFEQQPYGHLPLISRTIRETRARRDEQCWNIKNEPGYTNVMSVRPPQTSIYPLLADSEYCLRGRTKSDGR